MDTETYIIINIHNEPELLKLILDTMPYLPGWKINNNVSMAKEAWKNYPNRTASYFSFDFSDKEFAWEVSDENISDCDKEAAISIKNMSHLSIFLDGVYDMTREMYPDQLYD